MRRLGAVDGLGRAYVLDLATGSSRQLSAQPRIEPTDTCGLLHTIPTGTTYVYDLLDGTESQSALVALYDAWPHGT